MAGSIIEHFGDLEDPRRDNRRHQLIDIVFITICAVICNAESWEDIEQFGDAKEEWLRKYLQLPHGIPTEDTFARVFAALHPGEFNRCFLSWVKAVHRGGAQTIPSTASAYEVPGMSRTVGARSTSSVHGLGSRA